MSQQMSASFLSAANSRQLLDASSSSISSSAAVVLISDSRAPQTLHYQVNDLINLTCIAGASKPVARLNWYLNDAQVPAEWLLSDQQHNSQTTTTTTTKLSIAFRLQPQHFASLNNSPPHLKLKCVSFLSLIFGSEATLSIGAGFRRPSVAHLLEPEVNMHSLEKPSRFTNNRYKRDIQIQRVIWTNKQLRAHSDLIDSQLRLSKPNDFEPPLVEARALSQTDLATLFVDSNSNSNKFVDAQQALELLNLTCKTRTPKPETTRLEWLVNGKLIDEQLTWLNSLTPTKQFTFDKDADSRHRRLDTQTHKQLQNNSTFLIYNTNSTSNNAVKSLLLELNASLRSFKELEIRCRALFEVPLVEYETQVIISPADANLFPQIGAAADSTQRPLSATPTRHYYTLRPPSRLRPSPHQNRLNSNQNNGSLSNKKPQGLSLFMSSIALLFMWLIFV